jgi:nucleoside-diphosphate-sugar epimerase
MQLSSTTNQPAKDTPILITGGGGFIGGWLAKDLLQKGFTDVRSVDVKPLNEWYQVVPEFDNQILDLQLLNDCRHAVTGRAQIFNLAADMGGMGFIEMNKAACMLSSLINTHLLVVAREAEIERFFFSSSACVYNADKQKDTNVTALKEDDAYPAMPEDGYGWEKLFAERMVRHFDEDFGIVGRVARYHNVYGPHGTWDGGREKAPAAVSRKVAQAVLSGKHEIEIWGDGEQTRSFTYIEDTLHGTELLMWSDVSDPLNIGSNQLVTINELVSIVENIAGVTLERKYNLDAPKGVRGRNSDNTLVSEKLGWAPHIPLQDGMEKTYSWVYDQVLNGPRS